MDEQPMVERSVEVEATPEEVWERIVDGDLAEEWLGVTVEPRPGGAVTVPGDDTIGTVEEVDRGRSITWSWRQPDGDPSQVTIEVEPAGSGSRVTVIERLLEYRITGAPPTYYGSRVGTATEVPTGSTVLLAELRAEPSRPPEGPPGRRRTRRVWGTVDSAGHAGQAWAVGPRICPKDSSFSMVA